VGAISKFSTDPLYAGFYTIAEAARLLNIPTSKARGWLNGWSMSDSGPIIKRDFKESRTVSFLDLMEMRFIEYFRKQDVSMHTLRMAAEKARAEWDKQHPFALSKAKYLTDRRTIFAQVAEAGDDRRTWDMATGQMEMWEAIESAIAKGVIFDPATDLALRWKPRQGDYPDVVVDPKKSIWTSRN